MPTCSYLPRITLDPRCRITTPNWDRFLERGPLTDVRIFEYEKAGRYGPERQLAALAVQKQRDLAAKTHRKPKTLGEFLKLAGVEL
jgi:hypothetical protein